MQRPGEHTALWLALADAVGAVIGAAVGDPTTGRRLSDQEKIDRAAWHEDVRFYKKQQWAVAAAGVALMGGVLLIVRGLPMAMPMKTWEKCVAITITIIGIYAGGYFIDDLQKALEKVRRSLDPFDPPQTLVVAVLRASIRPFCWGAP